MKIFASPLSEALDLPTEDTLPNLSGNDIAGLKDVIGNLLNKRLSELELLPEISAIFKARTSRMSRKMMESWCLWVATINMVLTGFDIFSVRRSALWSVIICRALISASFIAANLALRRNWLIGKEHFAIIISCLIAMISAGIAGRLVGDDAIASDYNINALLVVFSAITFVSIDVMHARFLACLSIILIGGFTLAGGMPHLAVRLQSITLYAGTMLAMLQARRILNLHQHRLFLLNLREKINAAETTDRNAELSTIAYIDQLTEIPNRRYFDELCAAMTEQTKNLLPLSLCMIDIDHFKRLNDSLGHLQGDHCLRQIASTIRHNLRGKDIVVRYGGEEFVLVLPSTDAERAVEIAGRIRAAIAGLKHQNPGSPHGVVTASIGVAMVESHPVNIEALMERADAALYRAKNDGRNTVCV